MNGDDESDDVEQPQEGGASYHPPSAPPPSYLGGIETTTDTGDDPAGPDDTESLLSALRTSPDPDWLSQPQSGAEGYQSPSFAPAPLTQPSFAGNKTDYQAPFPETTAADIIEAVTAEIASRPDISFLLEDATTSEGNPPATSNKVLVHDGQINGDFHSGMGDGNYVLDLPDPSDSLIYAAITFTPESLAITSRFLGVSGSGDFPESRVDEDGGFLYWLIGFTYFDDADAFQIHQSKVGDINFAFTYGALNGKPALLPVDSGPGWIDLDSIFS